MKKILILGGTGAMGTSLVSFLENSDSCVYVTSRKEKESYNNIIYKKGNAHDLDFLSSLLEDNNYDCIVDFMVYSTEEFKSRAELLLKATKQYIFISSSRVYADCSDPVTEESPRLLDVCKDSEYLCTDEYALTKARQEDIIINSGFKNYTIIRPYITYNTSRLQLGVFEKEYWLERALRKHTVVFSNDIAEKMTTLTYGKDVAFLMSRLIGNEKALGEIFNITTSKTTQWKSVLETYTNTLEELGYNVKIKMLPQSTDLSKYFNKYQIQYDRLYDRKFDNTKILKTVDLPEYQFKDPNSGLKECLMKFINENHTFLNKSYNADGFFDRICNEYMKFNKKTDLKKYIKYLIFRFIICKVDQNK